MQSPEPWHRTFLEYSTSLMCLCHEFPDFPLLFWFWSLRIWLFWVLDLGSTVHVAFASGSWTNTTLHGFIHAVFALDVYLFGLSVKWYLTAEVWHLMVFHVYIVRCPGVTGLWKGTGFPLEWTWLFWLQVCFPLLLVICSGDRGNQFSITLHCKGDGGESRD